MSSTSRSKTTIRWFGFLVILGVLLLFTGGAVGSPPASPPAQEEIPPAETDASIRVEGHLVPFRYADLSLALSGQVAEVMVQEGDQVEDGTVLLRLGGGEQLSANIAAAELELLSARQSLEELHRNAGLELAEAKKELAEAQKVLAFAEDKFESLKKPAPQSQIDQVYANMLLAENALEKVRDNQQRLEKKFANKHNIIWLFINKRQFKLLLTSMDKKVAYAERRHVDAVSKYNDLREPADPIDLAQAEADLALAQARVAEIEQVVESLQDGPDPDEIAAAEARLRSSETALLAAETAFTERELVAPFAGKVVDLSVKAGEWAEANQPLIILADTSQWIVETDDLTEIEVPSVSEGGAVTVSPDALPELELGGVVESIKGLYEEKRGDITYTTRISLNENDPRLRWGMTVVITFDE